MHLKFQKFLGGMPSDPPGAHTCDERTASLSPTPHAPPSKILDPPLNDALVQQVISVAILDYRPYVVMYVENVQLYVWISTNWKSGITYNVTGPKVNV